MTIYVYNLHINGIKIYMLFYKLFFSTICQKDFFKTVYRQIYSHIHTFSRVIYLLYEVSRLLLISTFVAATVCYYKGHHVAMERQHSRKFRRQISAMNIFYH